MMQLRKLYVQHISLFCDKTVPRIRCFLLSKLVPMEGTIGRFFWIQLLILRLLSIGSLQLTERQGMRSVFHRLLWCWIINAALLVPVWSCGLVECLEYSPQNQFSLPFEKKNMRKLAQSSDLGRWSVPDGHWCFCRGTNLSKHKICAVVVPLNCSEKCCEEIFQTIVFFTCCNFSIMFTPSNIDFHFGFFPYCNFWPFSDCMCFWLESWGVIHLMSLWHLNFLMLLEFNISSNTVMRCYSVMKIIFPQVQVRHPNSSTLFQDTYWLEAALFKRCINNADFSLILSYRPDMESDSLVFEDHAAATSYNKLNL